MPLEKEEDEIKLFQLGIQDQEQVMVKDDSDFKGAAKWHNPNYSNKRKKDKSALNYKSIIGKQNIDGSYDKKVLPLFSKLSNSNI
jgi:hypothetical protein